MMHSGICFAEEASPRGLQGVNPASLAAMSGFVLSGFMLALGGTGSVYDVARVHEWGGMVADRVPFQLDIHDAGKGQQQRPDLRSASRHLDNIRAVLNPAIAELASVFGVSRQAIYKWISGESTPEADNFERIRALSEVADAFREAGVARASSVLKMKVFDGRSLLDLVGEGQLLPSHVQVLIDEAARMEAAHARSGLARSRAKPSDDWRAEISIPGRPE